MTLQSDLVRAFFRNSGEALPDKASTRLVNKRFRKFRSDLSTYTNQLQFGTGYEPRTSLSPHEAVTGNLNPRNLFVISLIPPDVIPTGFEAPVAYTAPQRATLKLVELAPRSATTGRAGQEGIAVETTESEATVGIATTPDQAGPAYLRGLQDRILNFESLSEEQRRASYDQNNPLVLGREEFKDTFLENSKSMQKARNPAQDLLDLREQILEMASLPPLVMLINPKSLNRNYTQVISEGSKTRTGYVIEHWGEELPTLSAEGTVGAFLIDSESGTGGLYAPMEGSGSYQQFMALYNAYRNNATILNRDGGIALVGAVQIYYDNTIYTGSFDSFSFSFEDSAPFSLTYSFSFTVRYEQYLPRA